MNPLLSPDAQASLVLASRSPRRHDILTALGFDFEVDPASESAEASVRHDDPFELPRILAARKCAEVAGRRPGDTVVGADTVVIIDGRLLSKPADDEEARSFLSMLSGRTHTVVTGVTVERRRRGVVLQESARTDVTFRELSADEIAAYVATGEGRDKAGSYAAQGLGSGLIDSINGCFYNVVGLPVSLLLDLLKKAS